MEVRTLEPFGAAISGLGAAELSRRHGDIATLLREHALVVVENADIPTDAHIDLVRAIGPLLDESQSGAMHSFIRHEPDVTPPAGGIFEGPLSFHSDLTYTSTPHDVLSLFALELPATGGATRFANTARALGRLPAELRAAVEGRRARHVYNPRINEHSGRYHEADLGSRYFAAEHAMVRRNTRTDRDVLFVNQLLTDSIVGVDRTDSDRLLDALFAVLYGPDNVYVHEWKRHDLVMWDNVEVQHARSDFDLRERRVLRRVIAGDPGLNARHNVEFAAQLQSLPGDGAVLV